MPEKIRSVFFEIKNVVLGFDPRKMRRQIANFCGIDEQSVERLLTETGLGDKYEKGEIDSRTLFHYLPVEIRGDKGFSSWAEAVSDVFFPNDSITVLLKELKRNQIKLCIFSNICELHFSYAYTRFPAFHLFDEHILSFKTGMKKPDYQFYEHALQKTNREKGDSFFIEGVEEYAQKARLLDLDCESYLHIDLLRSQLKKRKLLT